MKVSNATLDSILKSERLAGNDSDQELIEALAEDLKKERQSKREIIRFVTPMLSAPVEKLTKVNSRRALEELLGARAPVIEIGLVELAAEIGAEPFPAFLVPEQTLWILQLKDKRRRPPGSTEAYPICRAKTKAELVAFVDREACEPYVDAGLGKVFKKGGPLEWFYAPESDDSYVDVIGNTTQYVAAARQSIPDVSTF